MAVKWPWSALAGLFLTLLAQMVPSPFRGTIFSACTVASFSQEEHSLVEDPRPVKAH